MRFFDYHTICVWYNPKRKKYYYKALKILHERREIGYENSYGHKLILIINLEPLYHKRISLKKRLIKRTIRFLEKINKR